MCIIDFAFEELSVAILDNEEAGHKNQPYALGDVEALWFKLKNEHELKKEAK